MILQRKLREVLKYLVLEVSLLTLSSYKSVVSHGPVQKLK